MFWRKVIPTSSWVNPHHKDEWHYNPLHQGTNHITQHHTSVDLNPKEQQCENLKPHNPEVLCKFQMLIFFCNHNIFHKFHRHYGIHHPTIFAQIQTLQPVQLTVCSADHDQIPYTPVISSLSGSNIFLSTLFWNTPGICSSLNTTDEVCHPHKIGKHKDSATIKMWWILTPNTTLQLTYSTQWP